MERIRLPCTTEHKVRTSPDAHRFPEVSASETAAPAASQPTAPRSRAVTAFAGAGAALEPRLYYDPEAAALEQSAIFERTWQLAGHVSDLPEPGSYVTAQRRFAVADRDPRQGRRAAAPSATSAVTAAGG